jgi:hypothetical protein
MSKTPTVINTNALQSLSESVFNSNINEAPGLKTHSITLSPTLNITPTPNNPLPNTNSNQNSNIISNNSNVSTTNNKNNNKQNENENTQSVSNNNNNNVVNNSNNVQSEGSINPSESLITIPTDEEEEDPEIKNLIQSKQNKQSVQNQTNGNQSLPSLFNQQQQLPINKNISISQGPYIL